MNRTFCEFYSGSIINIHLNLYKTSEPVKPAKSCARKCFRRNIMILGVLACSDFMLLLFYLFIFVQHTGFIFYRGAGRSGETNSSKQG